MMHKVVFTLLRMHYETTGEILEHKRFLECVKDYNADDISYGIQMFSRWLDRQEANNAAKESHATGEHREAQYTT
ncbi:hypothetical protein [Alkalicoccus chagannorensis]|uniref:hypothetical protein n=1 Tax=Alkalicoccus chagannorensis TaxID=427072 RepID=UPI0012EC3420|nr:hypothetical protein [Alkalicoccus chagannorensis]